jgi:predicted esterase
MRWVTAFLLLFCLTLLALYALGNSKQPGEVAVAEPLPPAGFIERDLVSLRVLPVSDGDYAPSAEIMAAASLQETGIGPFGRSWYELQPSGNPPAGMVVLLHGAGRNGLSMLEMWEETARRHDLLLVAPNSKGSTWARDGADLAFITAAARQAAAAHGVPAGEVFLFGHSDGAGMAQEVLNRAEAGLWQAAAVHAGFAGAGRVVAARAAAPFRIYLGSEDHIFSVAAARGSAEAMATHGHPAELLVIPGHTHWFYDIGPDIARHAWAWFESVEAE